MSVCAIVLNYHGAQKTRKCLESLLSQDIDTIFVLDNSEVDLEYKSLQRIISQIQSQSAHPIFIIERMKVNQGFAGSINYVINRINSWNWHFQYYVLINNDAVMFPGVAYNLAKFMDENEDVLAVSPTIVDQDKTTKVLWYNRLTGSITKSKKIFSFPYISGCCILIRSGHNSDNHNLLDDSFFMYGEDVYFCWEAKMKNQRVVCLDNLFVSHHEMGSSRGKGHIFVEYHLARARILLAIKARRNVVEIPFQVVGHTVYLLVRAGLRTLRYGRIDPIVAFFLMWLPLAIRPQLNQ